MPSFAEDFKSILPPKIKLPSELELLFNWLEAQGQRYHKNYLALCPIKMEPIKPQILGGSYAELRGLKDVDERHGGTELTFHYGPSNIIDWFGNKHRANERLFILATTGGEGSMAAFWIDDDGHQKIVHIGSGSGSSLCCILAEDPIDFIRLISIGYDEICWEDGFDDPPNEGKNQCGMIIRPNIDLQNWVSQTFQTTIPRTASEIVRYPHGYGDDDSPDDFCRWINNIHN